MDSIKFCNNIYIANEICPIIKKPRYCRIIFDKTVQNLKAVFSPMRMIYLLLLPIIILPLI